MFIRKSLDYYLKALSSESPTPGGGSAAALVGASGVSLLLMVASITRKKRTAAEKKKLDKLVRVLKRILKDTRDVIDLDPRVYGELLCCYQRKRGSNQKLAERKIQTALVNSFRLQANLAFLMAMAKESLSLLHDYASGSIRNDLIVGRAFLDGAFLGAIATARINLKYLISPKRTHFERGLQGLERKYHGVKVS